MLAPFSIGQVEHNGIGPEANRYGTLGRLTIQFFAEVQQGVGVYLPQLLSVNIYDLQRVFITPHRPEQNGLFERVIRKIIEECVQLQRLK